MFSQHFPYYSEVCLTLFSFMSTEYLVTIFESVCTLNSVRQSNALINALSIYHLVLGKRKG